MTSRGKLLPVVVIVLIALAGLYGEWHGLASHPSKPEPAADGNAPSAPQAISRGGIPQPEVAAKSGQTRDAAAGAREASAASDFTPWLAGATALLALASFWQVAITRNTARRQLRAYVFVRATAGPVANGKTRCEVVVRNSGQTPASSVTERIAVWIDAYPQPASPPAFPPSDDAHPYSIGPSADVVRWRDVDLSPADLKEVRAEKKAIWMLAQIRYVDVFGKAWKTEVKDFMTGARIDAEDRAMRIRDTRAT